MTEYDIHSLAGAYALDALSDIERHAFQAHLADCETCAQETRELAETAARLGTATSLSPPSSLKNRVMDSLDTVRQLPPTVAPAGPRRRAGYFRHLPMVAAAACLAVALVLGTLLATTRSDLQHQQSVNAQISAVLAAPDAQTLSAPVASGGLGTVVVSRSQQRAVVAMSGLSKLPKNRAYELWQMGTRPPLPAGLMRTGGHPILVSLRGSTDQIGITVEAAAGSPAPTTSPVFAVRLPT